MSESFEGGHEPETEPERRVESFGNPQFEQFAPAIGAAIKQIDGDPIKTLLDSRFDKATGRSGSIDGQAGDSTYKITLPPTDPNQGFVGFITLERETGEKFEAVIKVQDENVRNTVKEYLQVAEEKPIIKDLTPEVYGLYGNWAIIEKLHGVESQGIRELLESDLVFRQRYVENSYQLTKTAADHGVDLNDVNFGFGHNVMADPESGEMKLMELGNVAVDHFSREARELLTQHLIYEVRAAARPEEGAYRQNYVYELTRRVLEDFDQSELYVRPRGYSVDHKNFVKAYNAYSLLTLGQHDNEMTEEKRKAISANPKVRDKFMAPAGADPGYHAQALHPDLLEAAQAGDREKFLAHLKDRKGMVPINDSNDPRTEIVFLE